MAHSLEEQYEKAADAYRQHRSEKNRREFHELRDELAERRQAERADRVGISVTTGQEA
jgi:glutaredoxin-related protein